MPKALVCPDSGKRMTAGVHVVSVCCPACGGYFRLTKDRRLVKHTPASGAAVRQDAAVSAIAEWKRSRK